MDLCVYCEEEIPKDERAACHQPMHWYCLLRGVAGSVAHQMGACSCCVPGSEASDEPGLTRREAARAAAEYFYWRQHGPEA